MLPIECDVARKHHAHMHTATSPHLGGHVGERAAEQGHQGQECNRHCLHVQHRLHVHHVVGEEVVGQDGGTLAAAHIRGHLLHVSGGGVDGHMSG